MIFTQDTRLYAIRLGNPIRYENRFVRNALAIWYDLPSFAVREIADLPGG